MPIGCEHKTCNPNDSVWLPKKGFRGHRAIARRRYCISCGVVKVDGDGRGCDIGYYFSLLGNLKTYLEQKRFGRKLTKTDVRLMCGGIRSCELFTDPYGSQRSMQEKTFIDIVLTRRSDLNPVLIREFVLDFRSTKRQRSRST